MAQYSFGAGFLFGVRTDVANSTPVSLGVMQDTSIMFSGDLKPLYGGGQFPVAFARGKFKIEGKSKLARINGRLFNDLFLGQTLSTGQVLTSLGEVAAVPAMTTYTVTAANAATFGQDLGVFYAITGLPFTKVASAPTVGQYSVSSAGVYTFAAADASAAVLLNYTYTSATTGTTIAISQSTMGNVPLFRGVFTTSLASKVLTLTLNNCASSKLNFATKQDDWTIPELDFEAGADASGNVGSWAFSE
jgi:hypothetical protein